METIYEKSLMTVQTHPIVDEDPPSKSLSLLNKNSVIPDIFQPSDYVDSMGVYYISDLHLDHHLVDAFPNGASDRQVEMFIHDIVQQLIADDYEAALRKFDVPILLIAGDVASSFFLSQLFYEDFVKTQQTILKTEYGKLDSIFAPIEDEITIIEQHLSAWLKKHQWVEHPSKPIEEYSDRVIPPDVKKLLVRKLHLRQQLEALEVQYGRMWKNQYKEAIKHTKVLVVLGNHEFWDFSSYDECIKEYSKLFDMLHICLLNNRCYRLNSYRVGSVMIVGSIGFSLQNKSFNAEHGIYGTALDGDNEQFQHREWIKSLNTAIDKAKNQNAVLIVLTHMPFEDWTIPSLDFNGCVFFSGHTHKNISPYTENRVCRFADNQIGYKRKCYQLKYAELYCRRNPYGNLPNGCHETNPTDYYHYCLFLSERIEGVGLIKRYIKMYNGKLYVIKQEGYYAFFLVTIRGTYICDGGRIIKLSTGTDITYYADNFMVLIKEYLKLISPLRAAQNKISDYVRKFGGSGRIHGTIVDIDFYNHIMLDTITGKAIMYYSPCYGMVTTYKSVMTLLHDHAPVLEQNLLSITEDITLPITTEFNETGIVDIKNSPYVISNRVNKIQYLFDKKHLRAWDDALVSNILKLVPN